MSDKELLTTNTRPSREDYPLTEAGDLGFSRALIVWQGDAIDRLTAERDRLKAELDNLRATDIHSCHDGCQRPACVMRRERDALKAENERLREALVTVRTSLHCTKRAPFEYDADHHCSECGWSSAYAKDVIDESLLGRHAENSLSDPQGMTPAVRELARYADHTFSCAMAERGYFDEDGNPVDCTCGYTQAIEAVLKASDGMTG